MRKNILVIKYDLKNNIKKIKTKRISIHKKANIIDLKEEKKEN